LRGAVGLKAIVGIWGLHLNRMAAPTAATAHAPRTISPHPPSRASVANRRWAHHGTAFGARYLSVCLPACLPIYLYPCLSVSFNRDTPRTHEHALERARAHTHAVACASRGTCTRAHTHKASIPFARICKHIVLFYMYVFLYVFLYVYDTLLPTSRLDKQDRNASA